MENNVIEFEFYGSKYSLQFVFDKYCYGNNLYVEIIDINENESFCDLTININGYIFENKEEIIVDNDTPIELIKTLEEMEILKDTGKYAYSGYARYKVMLFNKEKAKKYEKVILK